METTRELLSRLGDPQKPLRCVQVAGTNGKGSTCRFLHRILQVSGLRTGLFTSPHLVCVRERFVVGEEAIGEEAFADLFEEVLPHAEATGATYFETLTAMAALWYARNGAQALVLETGLGGRWDSTTAFPAEVCAVAQVGLDHMELLGDTVEKIWAEKIAILRPGGTLVSLERRPVLLDALGALATERGGRVVLPDADRTMPVPGLPPGASQPANFLLARFTDPDRAMQAAQAAGVVIRRRDSDPALPGCIRITVGTAEENEALLTALGEKGNQR